MNELAIVKYKPALAFGSWKLWDTCLKYLYYFGTCMTIGICIVLYFWGNYLSNLWILICPLGIALRKTCNFFRIYTKAYVRNKKPDLQNERGCIYYLYRDYADQLFSAGVMLGLYAVILIGKVIREGDNGLSIDWLTLLLVATLLVMSDRLERYSKSMLRELLDPPTLQLTWPNSDGDNVPIPSTPEKEKEPRGRLR